MPDYTMLLYGKCDRCLDMVAWTECKNLCYYHKKVKKGLIDKPPMEIPYTDIWSVEHHLEIYLKIARNIACGLFSPADVDDAVQHAGLVFNNVVRNWDDKKDTLFITYAYRSIKNQLVNYFIQKQRWNKRNTLDDRLDDYMYAPDEQAPDFLAERKERVDRLRDYYGRFQSTLDVNESTVFESRLLYDEKSQSEVADKLGITQQAVSKIEQRVTEKLRRYFDEIQTGDVRQMLDEIRGL